MLEGGFNLTKWLSNNREVLESIPVGVRADSVKVLDRNNHLLPTERAFGHNHGLLRQTQLVSK